LDGVEALQQDVRDGRESGEWLVELIVSLQNFRRLGKVLMKPGESWRIRGGGLRSWNRRLQHPDNVKKVSRRRRSKLAFAHWYSSATVCVSDFVPMQVVMASRAKKLREAILANLKYDAANCTGIIQFTYRDEDWKTFRFSNVINQ